MALANLIVSLWKGETPTAFICSGVHVAPGHILTVKHAFKDLQPGDRTWVGHLPLQGEPRPAILLAHHPTLDAAVFELTETVPCTPPCLPTLDGGKDPKTGLRPRLQVIDPMTHKVASPERGSIDAWDESRSEFLFSPHTAHGHSGGLLAVGEQPIGLLHCRIESEPIGCAIDLAVLRPWIGYHVNRRPGHEDPSDPDYETLLGLLGKRALNLLANPGTAELRRLAGFPRHVAELSGRCARDRFETLIVDLREATRECLSVWRTPGRPLLPEIKTDCHALLGELLKLAVDQRDRTPAELAELAAAKPERIFVACQHIGAAATVYCALTDTALRFAEPKEALDIHGGSVIDLTHLAMGVGKDPERDAMATVWLAYKGANPPEDFSNDERYTSYVNNLLAHLDMTHRLHRQDPRLLVAKGPREWLHGEGLASASQRLKLGLVIYSTGSDYAYLAVEEDLLINLACDYLQLLEQRD
jgi:hypothetical protein